MDALSIAGTGLAILGSKDLLNKILGPSAEYLGAQTKGLIEKCDINLNNIFEKAAKKLGERINKDGTVSPRILKNIWDEGRFCEDELAAEYFGGILASSRTENGRDDRGLALLATVKCLSVYQLRLHYFLYSLLKKKFDGQKLNVGIEDDRRKMLVFIPADVYVKAMEFLQSEYPDIILTHSMQGLGRENLVADEWTKGDKEYLGKIYKEIEKDGLVVMPSSYGIELFLWACGHSDIHPADYLTSKIEIDDLLNVSSVLDDISHVIEIAYEGIKSFSKRS